METRGDDDEAPTDPAARKQMHHDYTEQDFEGKNLKNSNRCYAMVN